jgi:hypothetical protein
MLVAKKQVRKRAAGAGRPRKLVADKKVDRISIRVDAETRRALEAALDAARAKNPRLTQSRVAEDALRFALLKRDDVPQPRNGALGFAIVNLAESIERETGQSWRTDIFTSMALRYAVEALLFHFAPGTEESPTIPEKVEERAAKMPDEFGQRHRRPAGLGHTRAHALITEIELRPRHVEPTSVQDFNQRFNEWSMPVALNMAPEKIGFIAKDFDLE